MSITKIHARQVIFPFHKPLQKGFLLGYQIFDSRGNPTVEVDLHTAKGEIASAIT
jgi:hypothetical protein